jgi:hypothetical protein
MLMYSRISNPSKLKFFLPAARRWTVPRRLSPLVGQAFTLTRKTHEVWILWRQGQQYLKRPSNIPKLLAGKAIRRYAGDYTLYRSAAYAQLVLRRSVDALAQTARFLKVTGRWTEAISWSNLSVLRDRPVTVIKWGTLSPISQLQMERAFQ